MKKTILRVFAIAILTLAAVSPTYAGIPISEATQAVAVESATAPVVAEKASEVKQTVMTAKQTRKAKRAAAGGKSQLVALILCGLVGVLGIHRFYLGYIWQGIVQLLTFGGFFGIWVLIDFIRIILGNLEPKDGPYDTTF